jgi:hypothetical protein
MAYQIFTEGRPRESWDQIAVLYAVRGTASCGIDSGSSNATRHIEPCFTPSAPGRATFADGRISWAWTPDGTHRFLTSDAPVQDVVHVIDTLMMEGTGVMSHVNQTFR